jgi:hypothetical protein
MHPKRLCAFGIEKSTVLTMNMPESTEAIQGGMLWGKSFFPFTDSVFSVTYVICFFALSG